MIVTRLRGGLGNQLFQYSAGRALAARHGSELVLDGSWFHDTPGSNTARTYELGRYPITARAATDGERSWCRLHHGRVAKYLPWLPRRWKHFAERSFAYQPALLAQPDGTYLDGYWQSYRYLEPIADVLRRELVPTAPPGPQDERIGELIRQGAAVSVHVRRGDYVTLHSAASFHGVCSMDYYARAFDQVRERLANPRFFVFSDDVEWTRQHLPLGEDAVHVAHNRAETAFQDLRLMSMCKAHVIANSSFSWWSAWLSPSKPAMVIAPQHWFADGRATPDLMPPDWIRL